MHTILLTWNPDNWPWDDRAADIEECRTTGKQRQRWSCGVTKAIPEGSRVYLMQVGKGRRGLIGSGRVLRSPFPEQHWDPARARRGDTALYIEVEFDHLADRPVVRRSELDTPPYDTGTWSPQNSGVTIPPKAAEALELLWKQRTTTEEYVARVCWNSKGWTEPTGEAARSEAGSYAAENGFGHEEWLFDAGAMIDGWHYGFLQPVSPSRDRLAGQIIDVRLFTISDEKRWLYVGRLPQCQVLTEEVASAAREAFIASGRLKAMEAQLRTLGAVVAGLRQKDPRWLVNVRFRPDTVERYDALRPVQAGAAIRQLPRYRLVQIDGERAALRNEWPTQGSVGLARPSHLYPDDIPPGTKFTEGAARTVTVNAYERNPAARAACLAHHGAACCVCGMTFEKVYGAGFKGGIHVHHLTPISALGKSYEVDPVKDLRPVCPNCHAAIHQRTPPYTPEELKGLLGT